MKSLVFVGVLLCASQCFAARQVLEQGFNRVPYGWEQVNDQNDVITDKIELVVAVSHPQDAKDQLESTLLKVSDPTHPDYGRHLTNEEVHDMIRPSAESITSVNKWLSSHGIQSSPVTPNSDFIRAYVTVPQIEELLQVNFSVLM